MEKVRYVEVKSSRALHFPILPFLSLPYLPTFHRFSPTFPFPIYSSLTTLPSRFPTSSSYLPLLLPFPIFLFPSLSRSSLFSSFTLNLPLSISTLLLSSQPSPFLLNLLRPYFSSSLPISFSLPIPFPTSPPPSLSLPIFPLLHPSLSFAVTLPLFLSPFPFPFPSFFPSLPLLLVL